ncbi:MAG: aminotransferase class V-fold PLP-dependent enzyme [Minisyncoccota bacterium]
MLNSQVLKKDFPIFTHHPDLVYLDSSATSLKPQAVIDAEREYLEQHSTNIARGLYPLAEQTTEKFERVREEVARFIGAANAQEIIFTSGTTAGINLTAQLLEHQILSESNIVVTRMEHHSNFLPWKELAIRKNLSFRIASIDTNGHIDQNALLALVDADTAIVALSAVSNVLGVINPVQDIIARIKLKNPHTIILIDAAQALAHTPINVAKWNADFVAFSAHKAFGPTGVGVLYGKQELLETLSPVTFGGGMVLDACASTTLYQTIPTRFEAGTPNISGIIAFGVALDYISAISLTDIRLHEISLTQYAIKILQATFGSAIHIIGPSTASERVGILSFTLADIHPHDIAHVLGEQNICVRAGEHCTAPLHRALGLSATARISFSLYSTKQDIDIFIHALQRIQKKFSK